MRLLGGTRVAVQGEPVVPAREPPALDAIRLQRQAIAHHVVEVSLDVALIVVIGLAEVLHQPIHHWAERPARWHGLAAGYLSQGPDRSPSIPGRDHVAKAGRGGRDVPGVWPLIVELEADELRLVNQEPVPAR